MSGDRAIRRDEGERLARVSVFIHCCTTRSDVFPLPLTAFRSSSCLQEYRVPFMETSAKTGVNVELAFTAVAKYETIIKLLLLFHRRPLNFKFGRKFRDATILICTF